MKQRTADLAAKLSKRITGLELHVALGERRHSPVPPQHSSPLVYSSFLFLQDDSEESDSYGSAYDPEDSRDDTIEQDGEWKGSEDTRYQYVTA
jgi:hypothetical protein